MMYRRTRGNLAKKSIKKRSYIDLLDGKYFDFIYGAYPFYQKTLIVKN
jgi:hypothetical protein